MYFREIKMSGLEKLSIRISYDEETGLSLKEFNNYLSGLNTEYSNFTNKKSELNIKSVSSGSVILEFTQQFLIPVLPNLISMGVYDFGKYLIDSVNYVQSHKDIVTKIKEKDKISIENSHRALVVTGDNVTINQINIETLSVDGTAFNLSLDKDNMNSIKNTVQPALENIHEEIKIEKRRQEDFESVELEFKTVTRQNSDGSYSGWIKDIHKDAKKITFQNENIKNSFSFNEEPFDTKYLVSVTVYYNGNGSIARYEILENLGEI